MDANESRRFAHGNPWPGWFRGVLATAVLVLPTRSASGEDVAKETSENPESFGVRIIYNVPYQAIEGTAGLCDIYVPLDQTTSIEDTKPAGWTVDAKVEGRIPAAPVIPVTPVKITGPARPAVVMVHGGGWVSGDKWVQAGYAKLLAKMGICVLNINYRLAPQHPFPAMVDDVRCALVYLNQNADRLAVDLRRVGMSGYSAGAHLSTLVGVMANEPMETRLLSSNWTAEDPRWDMLPQIRAVNAGGPPVDFRSLPPANRTMAYFLGGSREEVPDNYLGASVLAHVSPGDAAMQLIHGDRDFLVPIANSRQLLASLRQCDVPAELIVIEGTGHMMTFMDAKAKRTTEAFFRKYLLSETPGNPKN